MKDASAAFKLASALATVALLGLASVIWTKLGATLPGGARPVEAGPDSATWRRMAEYLDRIETFGYSGAVLIGSGNEVVHASGYGLADREAGRPYTTGTVFSVGSITKVYTAATVLRLVERGLLHLSDTLARFYPDVPADRAGITIEQLLTHTSGLGESTFGDGDAVSRERIEHEAFTRPLVDGVGAAFHYSNLGYSLLGAIIEHATGRPYEVVLREAVLLPSMAWETGYVLAPWEPERLAQGYIGKKRWGTVVDLFTDDVWGPGWVLRANGGLHSTVFDVYRFLRTVKEGRLLSPELTRAFTTPRIHTGEDSGETLGWGWERDPSGQLIIRHAGSNGIHSSELRILWDEDVTIIVSCNVGEDARDIATTLTKIALGQPYVLPPSVDVVAADEAQRTKLTGLWHTESGDVRVSDLGNVLRLDVEGQDLLDRVLAAGPNVRAEFAADNASAREIVQRAEKGDFASGGLKRVWAGIEGRFGRITAVDVMGTAPVWFASPRATWLRFHIADPERTTVRRLHWTEEGELFGVGSASYPAPLMLRCATTGPDRCVATHLNLETRPVEFGLREDGRAIIRVGEYELQAVRKAVPGGAMKGMGRQ